MAEDCNSGRRIVDSIVIIVLFTHKVFCLVGNILQNNLFSVQQKKEICIDLEQPEDEMTTFILGELYL